MIDYGLTESTIIVAGGASGIGRAIVDLAISQGCKVGLLDANEALLARVMSELSATGAEVAGRCLDVRDEKTISTAVEDIEATLGPISGLVNSAGISRPGLAAEIAADIWSDVVDVNLKGSFLLAREVGRRMITRGKGSIVLVSSVDGSGGHAARTHYSASKHGVVGLVKSLAIEWGRHGVRVNALCPGIVDTPLVRGNISADHISGVMEDRIPMARLSTGDDQAKAALFLLSDAAAYVSGTCLTVDGGLTAGYFTHLNGEDWGGH
tara:strand:- start:1029 stop:1826 length:798 start_codon:yes stop_codon:yes gene_type:complete